MNPYLMNLFGFFRRLDSFDSDSDDSDMDLLTDSDSDSDFGISDAFGDDDENDDDISSADMFESNNESGAESDNILDDDGENDDLENMDDDLDNTDSDIANIDDHLENNDDDDLENNDDDDLENNDDDEEENDDDLENNEDNTNSNGMSDDNAVIVQNSNAASETENNASGNSNILVTLPVTLNNIENPNLSTTINSASVRPESSPSTSKTVRKTKLDDSDAPPNKIRKLDTNDDDDDGETCPICLEGWSNSGEHKLVSLKCGHLFGAACVERWLKAQPAKLRSCPTCKTKASLKEIRYIYARKLVAADNSEICSLQKELEKVQADKNRIELECVQLKMSNRNYLLQLNELKSRMIPSRPSVVRQWSFALDKNVEICEGRVLTYNCRSYDLYVSQKSNNNLFPGYGVKKFNCVDYKFGNNILLHKKPIRDIAYNSNNDLLLSVSLDGTARIVERCVPCQATQPTDIYALWSCAWDEICQNKFYIGGASGNLQQFDLRNLNQPICSYNAITDKSPVASICSTPYGLISCQLNSCWLWQNPTEPVLLPVEGPFMSVAYESSLQKLLVACRPTRSEKGRLLVCKFDQSESGGTQPSCLVEKTFYGTSRASVLCRSAWITVPETSWVASHSESESSLYLYNMNNSRTVCIPASEPALDICNIQVNEENMMATVSDFRLRIYKAIGRS